LHCADRYGYAHIKTDKHYYERIETIIDAKKEDGSSLVVGISAQAEPTNEMIQLCKGKHEIKYSLHDRVGVLKDPNLASMKEPHKGKFECSLCGAQINSHVVCPDGTVVLCNNDFAMQYVLGNLYENTFDELQNGPVIKRVLEGMHGDTSIDLICRRCVCTHAL
jgi:radical SAM protein with 4Fe4S-binding SPASM domain